MYFKFIIGLLNFMSKLIYYNEENNRRARNTTIQKNKNTRKSHTKSKKGRQWTHIF